MRVNPNYLLKLKRILIPFAVVAWGTLLLLAFIRWWLFLDKHPILELSEEMWEYWIPVAFPWAPILIWLKPRFDTLEYRVGTNRGSWQMQCIAWISMAAMLIPSQYYMSRSAGKLLEVKNVKEISKHERVRYYRIKEFAVYKFIGGVHYSLWKNGKFNQNLDIDIYFVNPILTHKKQFITMTPRYWYGVKFHKRISNLNGEQTQQRRIKAFFDECVKKMETYDYHKLDYFEHKPASDDRKHFRVAVQYALRKPVNNDFVILQPRKGPLELRQESKLIWVFGLFLLGLGLFMLALIKPRLESPPAYAETLS
jgi:rhomboid protease GluP